MSTLLAVAGSRAALTRVLLSCYALTGAVHVASIMLNTLLPFHLVALGGSRTQVGLLFSATTVLSMMARPLVGGWIDRFGATPIVLPGIAALGASSLLLHLRVSPVVVIAIMVPAGIGTGLVSMTASVLTVRGSSAKHRGEALSVYYLCTSLALAVSPPLAFALRRVGGMPLAFVTVTALTLVMLGLALSFPGSLAAPVAGTRGRFRLLSRPAASVSGALVLTTIGYSSIYAFVPLYAVSRGHGYVVVWFFTAYSIWLIIWRALLGGLADRFGRVRVALPAMILTALAYLTLALPLTPASLMAAALLLASGNAVLYPTLAALVVDRAPDTERGLALGTLSGAWDLGVVVGSSVVGFVADHVSFPAGFATAGIAALLGSLSFFVTERRPRPPRRVAFDRTSG